MRYDGTLSPGWGSDGIVGGLARERLQATGARPPARLRRPQPAGAGGPGRRQPPQHAQGRPGGPGRAEPAGPAPRRARAVRGRPADRGQQEPSSCSGWPAAPATSTPGTPSPTARSRTAGPSASSPPGCPACCSASTCRSRRPCSTGSPSSARWTPGTATTSRTRSSRPANLEAEPRLNPSGRDVPGDRLGRRQAPRAEPTRPCRPTSRSRPPGRHVAYGGYLGQQYDPFIANRAARLPIYTNVGVGHRPHDRGRLLPAAAGLDPRAAPATAGRCWRTSTGCAARSTAPRPIEAMDRYGQQAVEMLVGRRAQAAFDLSREPEAVAGPLRQAPVVPAGAAGPAAGGGGGRPSSRST